MKKILKPNKREWAELMRRPAMKQDDLFARVHQVFSDIQKDGDKAVKKYTRLFDKVDIEKPGVGEKQMNRAVKEVSKELQEAIQLAMHNIETFHAAQREKKQVVETTKGVKCWRETRPIEKVGIYIPGGTAPLFSTVLMLGVPAKLAGCKEIVLCTPPDKDGKIHPAILLAAKWVGVTKVFAIGGIQAIAALALGTRSVPKVDKILGPGNQYVTAAKQVALNFGVAIDMPAGPSEVLVIADDSANPEFVAADLLSQAEHGADSQVILLSDSANMVEKVLQELKKQLQELPRRDIAEEALKHSKAFVLNSLLECVEFSNAYAPEHLIVAVKKYDKYLEKITNAGSVFLGKYSCESAGDYASGTNHTLPTQGYARNYSGVSLDSFVKKITFQKINKSGIRNIGPAIEIMAEAEQLMAHKSAVTVRLKNLR